MFCGLILICLTTHYSTLAETPKFRILAPQFICPKDEDAVIEKPDNTVITIQTSADSNLQVQWNVRWKHLQAPSQRFTLMLWKAIRELEKKLNKPQPEPYVYVIDNDQLLAGVNYVFNVASVDPDGNLDKPKSFNIDNTQGDQKLELVEGRGYNMFSIIMIGDGNAFVDLEIIMEAQVTTCHPTQDYHFVWTVRSTTSDDNVDVSLIKGSRLTIPPYSLKAGLTYDANCQVIKSSNGLFITETGLPFQVLHRGFKVYISIDKLLVSVNHAFSIDSFVVSQDYYEESLMFKWECTFENQICDKFEDIDDKTLNFPYGLSKIGQYQISVTVSISDISTSAYATITTVDPILPVIQILPQKRVVDEGQIVSLVANASNVAPSCTLTWYFASEEFIALSSVTDNDTCGDCQHGEPLTESLTILSLEENFLNELTDYTNETQWHQITATMIATSGRARFVANCGCSLTFDCNTLGMVYADVNFVLNESPKPGVVMVFPETGAALETLFRISTLAVVDPDVPIRYSFYCRIKGNITVLLGSYLEHRSVEYFLPYIDEQGTEVWVEVCDSLGACFTSSSTFVMLSKGEDHTLNALIDDVNGMVTRCEMLKLQRISITAVVSLTNTAQEDALSKFTRALKTSLINSHEDNCFKSQQHYQELLQNLGR